MTAPRPPATIQPIDKASPEAQSANLVDGNLAQLKAMFPEAFTEGRVDFEVLKQLLGAAVDEREEKYGLNWHGKRRARQLALTPSTGTLRPCPEESVDWDTTQNLMIEGDNLEVLKLLQRSYANKVKLIYIDPPYNTGKDFVYPDKFQDSIQNYLQLTGQVEGGEKISSNTESSGRFHTDWLNMMYPRLKLARSLLRTDGAIFISIDDREKTSLMAVMQEVFGDENFVGTFVWKRRTGAMDSVNNVSTDHEYVVCFSRSAVSLNGEVRTFENYSNPDDDARGPWIADNLSAAKPGGDTFYPISDPKTGHEYLPPKGRYWPYSRATMEQKIAEGRIIFPKTSAGSPLLKRFQNEAKSLVQPISTWVSPLADKSIQNEERQVWKVGHTSEGTKLIKDLFGEKIFNYAKPLSLLDTLIAQGTSSDGDDIVLDFFAGSATTGHAAMARNAADSGNRRFIMVQLPEPLSSDVDEQKDAANYCDTIGKPRSIAELSKERLRRAGRMVRDNSPLFHGDLGFRVFKLDRSNIAAWDASHENIDQTLLDRIQNIVSGRSEMDLLYEISLKLGLDLCTPIEKQTIAHKEVYCVGAGVLFLCLSKEVRSAEVESLGLGIASWSNSLSSAGSTTCVFRDDAFEDDITKTNLAAILVQHGIFNIRSV